MTVSNALVFTAVISSLLVFGGADPCAPDCQGRSDFHPHPQDCNSFYQCASGTPFLQRCAATLQFSPTSLRCDYPAQAACTADPARECEGPAPSPVAPQPTTASPKACLPTCPWEHAYIPHPRDCTKFYICGGGKVPVEFNCQQGLRYDMMNRRCDYPENVNCVASPERACDENLLD